MKNQIMQYTEGQYEGASDPTINLGFTNYERLMLELNNREYYPKETYEKFLNENGLVAEEPFDKDTDYGKLLETAYSILKTLLGNIDLYRKIETEFTTTSQAATALQSRLKELKAEINRINTEMSDNNSDFTFMYFTR